MITLKRCLFRNPKDIEKLYSFTKFDALVENIIIHSANEDVKRKTAEGIITILELDELVLKQKGIDIPTSFFFQLLCEEKLFSLLRSEIKTSENAYTFFELASSILLQMSKIGNAPELDGRRIPRVAEELHELLVSQKITEVTESDFDSVLAGSMKML